MYDVVIVGGSLSGAATAIHLADAGLRVTLVERGTGAPRPKACGEGLFPAGVRELRALGVGPAVDRGSVSLSGIRFHAAGWTAAAPLGSGETRGRGIRREVLDPALLERAREAGVEVRCGAAARGLIVEGRRAAGVQTGNGDVRARVVVGADGLHSVIRRAAGLAQPARGDRYGLSIHVRTREPAGHWVDVHFGVDHELYFTPVAERLLNVALLARRRFLRRVASDSGAPLREFLASHPAMPSVWEPAGAAVGAGPFPVRARRRWRANVVLVGDAGGFFDGITGEGMSLALVSARLCAGAVEQYLESGDVHHLRRYEAACNSLARNSELLGRAALVLAARPPLARLAVRNLARRPETFGKLLSINAGEADLSALRPRDVAALVFGL